MNLVLNMLSPVWRGGIVLILLSGWALAQTEPDAPADEPVVVVEEEKKVSKADTTEITWRDRRFIIITDEEGKRIEVKDADKDEEYNEEWDEESEDHDDEDYDYRNKEEVKDRREKSEVDLLGLDLGITNYFYNGEYGPNAINPELQVREFRPGSHVALHLLPTRVSLIGRGYVNLKTAITIDWSNYYFSNDITLDDSGEMLAYDTTGISYDRNKLTSRYVQVPLMLNINSDPGGNDGVSISVGGYAGILWAAHTKQVSAEQGKVKVDGDFFLNPYRYGLLARVDFKWFDVYLQYNLSEMFVEGRGPQTQTFMAGLNLVNF